MKRGHVFSDAEREVAAPFAAGADRESMSERIDRVLAEVRERKRVEKAAAQQSAT